MTAYVKHRTRFNDQIRAAIGTILDAEDLEQEFTDKGLQPEQKGYMYFELITETVANAMYEAIKVLVNRYGKFAEKEKVADLWVNSLKPYLGTLLDGKVYDPRQGRIV